MKNIIQLRPFTESDWSCYSGCESADPMIGERDDFNLVVIMDGRTIQLITVGDSESPEEVWSKDLFPAEALHQVIIREVAEMILNSTNPTVIAESLGFMRIN